MGRRGESNELFVSFRGGGRLFFFITDERDKVHSSSFCFSFAYLLSVRMKSEALSGRPKRVYCGAFECQGSSGKKTGAASKLL